MGGGDDGQEIGQNLDCSGSDDGVGGATAVVGQDSDGLGFQRGRLSVAEVEIDWPAGSYQVSGYTFPVLETDDGQVNQLVLQLDAWAGL